MVLNNMQVLPVLPRRQHNEEEVGQLHLDEFGYLVRGQERLRVDPTSLAEIRKLSLQARFAEQSTDTAAEMLEIEYYMKLLELHDQEAQSESFVRQAREAEVAAFIARQKAEIEAQHQQGSMDGHRGSDGRLGDAASVAASEYPESEYTAYTDPDWVEDDDAEGQDDEVMVASEQQPAHVINDPVSEGYAPKTVKDLAEDSDDERGENSGGAMPAGRRFSKSEQRVFSKHPSRLQLTATIDDRRESLRVRGAQAVDPVHGNHAVESSRLEDMHQHTAKKTAADLALVKPSGTTMSNNVSGNSNSSSSNTNNDNSGPEKLPPWKRLAAARSQAKALAEGSRQRSMSMSLGQRSGTGNGDAGGYMNGGPPRNTRSGSISMGAKPAAASSSIPAEAPLAKSPLSTGTSVQSSTRPEASNDVATNSNTAFNGRRQSVSELGRRPTVTENGKRKILVPVKTTVAGFQLAKGAAKRMTKNYHKRQEIEKSRQDQGSGSGDEEDGLDIPCTFLGKPKEFVEGSVFFSTASFEWRCKFLLH